MKLYKIIRVDASAVYKTSKKEVDDWLRRNPGECEQCVRVDVMEELARLADVEYDYLSFVEDEDDEWSTDPNRTI